MPAMLRCPIIPGGDFQSKNRPHPTLHGPERALRMAQVGEADILISHSLEASSPSKLCIQEFGHTLHEAYNLR